jgi:hypothetical protein
MSKKSFFYNPQFRITAYIFGWVFLGIFSFLTLILPQLNKVVLQYRSGSKSAPFLVAGVGALILVPPVFFASNSELTWNLHDLSIVVGLYVVVALVGALSLDKMRYYDAEEAE